MRDQIITFKLQSKYHLLSILAATFCSLTQAADPLPLDKLNLPAGFSIAVFAEVENPRQMAHGEDGDIYVGSLRAGKVHLVRDINADGKADQVTVVAKNLDLPSGLAYREGDLYVGALNQILVFRNIQQQLRNKAPDQLATSEGTDSQLAS